MQPAPSTWQPGRMGAHRPEHTNPLLAPPDEEEPPLWDPLVAPCELPPASDVAPPLEDEEAPADEPWTMLEDACPEDTVAPEEEVVDPPPASAVPPVPLQPTANAINTTPVQSFMVASMAPTLAGATGRVCFSFGMRGPRHCGKTRGMLRPSVVAMLLSVASLPAAAGLVVTGEEPGRDDRAQDSHRVVRIGAQGIRLDQGGASHIVDAVGGGFVELNHVRKTVRRISFKDLGARMRDARRAADDDVAAARNRYAQLPPAVRTQVEDALRAQKSATQAREPGAYQLVPTGKKRSVNGFSCVETREMLNGTWVGTTCVHKDVKLPAPDAAMLKSLAKAMKDAGLSGAGPDVARTFLDGIPVEMASRNPQTGELRVEERVTRMEVVDVPASVFAVPPGYRDIPWEEQPLPQPPGHKH